MQNGGQRIQAAGWRRGLTAGLAALMCALGALTSVASSVPQLDYDFIDSYIDYRIYDLPPHLVFAKRFGHWQADGQEGLHRLLVVDAEEPLAGRQHLLHVQWVCNCPQGVVSMMPVSELNRAGPFIYTRPEIRRRGQTWYMSLVAENTRTRDVSRVNIFLPRPGYYRVEYETHDGPAPQHR